MPWGLTADDLAQDPGYRNCIIPNGQSLSDPVDLKGSRAAVIFFPAALDDGALTFQVSYDGDTYVNLYDKDGEVSIPATSVAINTAVVLDLPTFFGIRGIKVRTGTSAAPVVQTGQRTLVISTIPR